MGGLTKMGQVGCRLVYWLVIWSLLTGSTVVLSDRSLAGETTQKSGEALAEEKSDDLLAEEGEGKQLTSPRLERKVERYYRQGKRHYLKGRCGQAIKEFELALTLDPDHRGARCYLELARARMKTVEAFERIRARKKALKAAEQGLRKRQRLQRRKVKLLEKREAKRRSEVEPEEVERAEVRARKDEVKDYIRRGRKLYRKGQYASAIEEFRKAFSLDPTNSKILMYLKRCHKKLREATRAMLEDHKKALEKAKREAAREAREEGVRRKEEEARLAAQREREEARLAAQRERQEAEEAMVFLKEVEASLAEELKAAEERGEGD